MILYVSKTCASGSAVEHLLAKEGVAGSIPVSRLFFLFFFQIVVFYFVLVLSGVPCWFKVLFLSLMEMLKKKRGRKMIVKEARIMDPANGLNGIGDIVIRDGKIADVYLYYGLKESEIIERRGMQEGEEVLEASGWVAAPGLIDVHVHFRDPGFTYKEDIGTGAAAAAKGGFTTVVCMANTKPVVDRTEILQYVLEEGRKTPIHVLACAAVSKNFGGKELTDMEALKAAGAVGFTDDGIPLRDGAFVQRAMQKAKELSVPISFHEEDPAFIKNNGIHHGAVSERLGLYGSPALAENSLIARDCMIALDTGAAVNIQHISSAYGVELVRFAKRLGADIWAEATPHHFTLTEEAVAAYGTLAKMNPPLRTEEDRLAVIEGLKDGTIAIIATDHAPHSREEKERAFTEAPSGIIGLETSLALGITELVGKGYLTMMELIEKMSVNPARLYHLEAGTLSVGADADLVLFAPEEEWVVDGFVSKACNSPFTGWKLTGKVKGTICGGKIVYWDGMSPF